MSVGSVDAQRVPVLQAWVRADPADPREATLQKRRLAEAAERLASNEVLVTDRGFPLTALQEAGIRQSVGRAAQNFTARRNVLPEAKGHGRPAEYGDVVRPLARTRKERTIEATSPDRIETWDEGAISLRVEIFDDLVRPEENLYRCEAR